MKKLIVVFCLCFVASFYVNGQTNQGGMMVGGNLSFYTVSMKNNSDYENKGLGFSPSFGYFISDNLAVGASVNIGSSTVDTGLTKRVSTDFGIGPFARYYKFTSSDNFAFYAQARLLFESGKDDDTPGGEIKTSAISFNIAPGFTYFFNEHWAVDLAITGLLIESRDPNKDVDNNNETTVVFNISSFSPEVGLRYYFGN